MATQPRLDLTYTTTLPASPERVFPLLCPVREYDWIEGWRCRMVHTASGIAELDCVFHTDRDGDSLWTVSRYEPSRRIEFVITTDGVLLSRLEITLAGEVGDRTVITWRRVYTVVGPGGEARLDAITEGAFESRMQSLNRMLGHYLERGEMLRAECAPAAHISHGHRG